MAVYKEDLLIMENVLRVQIEQALDEYVRPYLLEHEGDVKIVDFEEGVLRVQLTGQCCGCPAANITTEEVVRKEMMRAMPEIRDVILDDGVTEDMMQMAKQFLKTKKVK